MNNKDRNIFDQKIEMLCKVYGKTVFDQEQYNAYWRVLSKKMSLDTFLFAVDKILEDQDKKSFPVPGLFIKFAKQKQTVRRCSMCHQEGHYAKKWYDCKRGYSICFQCHRIFQECKCANPLYESEAEWESQNDEIVTYYHLSLINNFGVMA